MDKRSFKKYLDKIKFVGHEGDYLIKLNKKASLENNYIKLQNSFFTKILKKLNLFKITYIYRNKFVVLEKNILFQIFYKIITANAYLIGHLTPNNKKNDNT